MNKIKLSNNTKLINLIEDMNVDNMNTKALVSIQTDIFNDFYTYLNHPTELNLDVKHYLPQLMALNNAIMERLKKNNNICTKSIHDQNVKYR